MTDTQKLLLALLLVALPILLTSSEPAPPTTPPSLATRSVSALTFPPSTAASTWHAGIGGTCEIFGQDWVSQSGSRNSTGRNPGAFAMRPGGEDEVPLATFTIDNLSVSRPTSVQCNVVPAAMSPGGEIDVPLSYWIGASDFSQSGWKWFGPFSSSQSIDLNSAAQRDRFISSAGKMTIVVLSDQLGGACGAEVKSLTVSTRTATDPAYMSTCPCCAALTPPTIASGSVTLRWTHVLDPINMSANEAMLYKVYRQRLGDATSTYIGTTASPVAQYVDPANNISGIPGPLSGQTYTYYLQATNSAGATVLAAWPPVTLP